MPVCDFTAVFPKNIFLSFLPLLALTIFSPICFGINNVEKTQKGTCCPDSATARGNLQTCRQEGKQTLLACYFQFAQEASKFTVDRHQEKLSQKSLACRHLPWAWCWWSAKPLKLDSAREWIQSEKWSERRQKRQSWTKKLSKSVFVPSLSGSFEMICFDLNFSKMK